MSSHEQITFTPAQQAHLDAWSMVYIDARIQRKLGITLSQFLNNPGKYLFWAWLTAAHYGTTSELPPLLPAQVAASQRISQRRADKDEN